MGILRTDRVAGLGGANAIKGSVFFPHDGDVSAGESGALQVQNANDALTFGTGDWTIEFWFYANRVGVVQTLYDGRGTGAGTNTAVLIRISDSNNIQFFTTNAFRITGSTTIIKNAWHHVALTRTGSTHTLYVNGSSDGTYSNSGMDYIGPVNSFAIIGSDDNRDGRYGLNGYISNLRVAKELIYSAAFTVPTTALTPTSNTTLLCCQSPGNVEASFGGLILTSFASNINSKGPVVSRFTPNSPVGFSTTTDVGTQFGSTFDGVTTFDSQAYFVPPGGNTRERNRGRAVVGGGYDNPNVRNEMDYFNIQSMGNAIDFGNLTTTTFGLKSNAASSTRGIIAVGGRTPTYVNTIEFITIATTSNATDFGDTGATGANIATSSNQTRGILMGGRNPTRNTIEFITIATTGNASDFGDLTAAKRQGASVASPTRAIYAGGFDDTNRINNIEFVTIASAGNASDFGDLTDARQEAGGASDNTRGVFAGGYDAPARVNIIDFITMASAGNAIDFGDTQTALTSSIGSSNNTRGVFPGYNDGGRQNTIFFVTIQNKGDAQDFGDLTVNRTGASCCSDSHGGLS